MREIKRIVVHCSASSKNATSGQLIDYHTRPKSKGGLGWSIGGYHIIIDSNAEAHKMYSFDQITNGVKGFNSDSIHVCLIGGKEGFDFSHEQMCELENQLYQLTEEFGMLPILGHRDLSTDLNGDGKITPNEWIKLCPQFDVKEWLKKINFHAE